MSDTNKKDGGPAFPCPSDDAYTRDMTGMSLRDYFAAHETLSDLELPESAFPFELLVELAGPMPPGMEYENTIEKAIWDSKWRSALKYMRADAMLKARNQQNG